MLRNEIITDVFVLQIEGERTPPTTAPTSTPTGQPDGIKEGRKGCDTLV